MRAIWSSYSGEDADCYKPLAGTFGLRVQGRWRLCVPFNCSSYFLALRYAPLSRLLKTCFMADGRKSVRRSLHSMARLARTEVALRQATRCPVAIHVKTVTSCGFGTLLPATACHEWKLTWKRHSAGCFVTFAVLVIILSTFNYKSPSQRSSFRVPRWPVAIDT
jgi:hypothetical protein